MAEEYVNKESLAKHIDGRFGEISTPFVVMEIRGFPTADVVPKSAFERLQHRYDLAVAEREANVKGFAEELSKAKSEVERLQEDVERLQEINNRQVENIRLAKSEVAREIFEEIEILMKIYTFPVVQMGVIEIVKEPFWCIEPNDFAAIKKKYTEEKE